MAIGSTAHLWWGLCAFMHIKEVKIEPIPAPVNIGLSEVSAQSGQRETGTALIFARKLRCRQDSPESMATAPDLRILKDSLILLLQHLIPI